MNDNIPTSLWIGYDANGRVPMQLTAAGYCPKTGLPMPRGDEREHQFFARAMGNHAMMQKFPGYKARANHALRRWREHGEAIKMAQQGTPVRNQAAQPPEVAVQHAKLGSGKRFAEVEEHAKESGAKDPAAVAAAAGIKAHGVKKMEELAQAGKHHAKHSREVPANIHELDQLLGEEDAVLEGPVQHGRGYIGSEAETLPPPGDFEEERPRPKPRQPHPDERYDTPPPAQRLKPATAIGNHPNERYANLQQNARHGDRVGTDTIVAPPKRRAAFGTQLPRQPRTEVGRVYQPSGSARKPAMENDSQNFYRGLNEQMKPVQNAKGESWAEIPESEWKAIDTEFDEDQERQHAYDEHRGQNPPVRESATLGVKYPDKDSQLAGERVSGMVRDTAAGRPVVPKAPPQTESERSDQALLDSQQQRYGQRKPLHPERNAARKNLSTEPGALRPARGNVLKPLKVREPKPPKAAKPPRGEKQGPPQPTSQQTANTAANFHPASAEGGPPAPKPSPNPARRPPTEGADRGSNQIARDQWAKEQGRPTLASTVATGLANTPASKGAFGEAMKNTTTPTSTNKTPASGAAQRHEGLKTFISNPQNKEHVESTVNDLKATNQSTVGPKTFSDMVLGGHLKDSRKAHDEYDDLEAAYGPERYAHEEGRKWKEGDPIPRGHETFRGTKPLTETRAYQPTPPKEQPPPPARNARQPSAGISPEKAKTILRDGEVRGHPLTSKQRGMFGAAAGHEKNAKPRIGGQGVTPTEFNAGPAKGGLRQAADLANLRQGYGNAIGKAVEQEEAANAAAPKPTANQTKVKQPTEVDWAAATAAGPKPKAPGLGMRIAQGLDTATEDLGQFLGAPGSEAGKHTGFQNVAKKLGFSRADINQDPARLARQQWGMNNAAAASRDLQSATHNGSGFRVQKLVGGGLAV